MSHTYVIYIFSESEFRGEFSENISAHAFFDSAHAKFWKLIFSEMRGRKFFRFQIRKEHKNPRSVISIDVRFILHTPTQNELSIFEGLWRLRMMRVFFKGLKLWPSCSEGSITPKKSKIRCIWPCFITKSNVCLTKKWKRLLVFSWNHNNESWWLYFNWFHQKAYKILHQRAFVILEFLFNLWKKYRDLERNGIQNAICAPGVNLQNFFNKGELCFIYIDVFKLDKNFWYRH